MSVPVTFIVDKSLAVVIEVANRIQQSIETDERSQEILSYIEQLTNVAKKMKATGIPETSYIEVFKKSLEEVESFCQSVFKKGMIMKVALAPKQAKDLKARESRLKRAVAILQLELLQVLITQNVDLKHSLLKMEAQNEDLNDLLLETKGDILNPTSGVYLPGWGDSTPIHLYLSNVCQPTVVLEKLATNSLNLSDKRIMAVEWTDEYYLENGVCNYEVRLHDRDTQKSVVIVASPTDLMFRDQPQDEGIFSLKIGPPRLKLGHHYSVRVRPTNGAGPGDWSNASNITLFGYPPKKPLKPSFSVSYSTYTTTVRTCYGVICRV